MNLKLIRKEFTLDSTIGELFVNDEDAPMCYTLEDVVREPGVKVPGKTAIPKGSYEVTITFSNRFQKPLPLLLRVPNFEGVRIHPGNTSADTEGCVLVGKGKQDNRITDSRTAFNELFGIIQVALQSEKVMLEIT